VKKLITLRVKHNAGTVTDTRKQARNHVRDARDFNNIETRAVIRFFFSLQSKSPKEIHAILTETLAFSILGRAKDLSAPRLCMSYVVHRIFFLRMKLVFILPYIIH